MLLTKELHALFGSGYVTDTPDREVKVSRRPGEEWENGRRYHPVVQQEPLVLSARQSRPSSKALQRHGEPALLSWKMPDPRAIDRGWIFGFHGGGGRRGVSTPGVARPPRCHDPLATTQTRPVPSTVAPRSTSPYADAAAGR